MASGGTGIALTYLVLGITWKLPDPGWLLSLFTFVPLCALVGQIDSINQANGSRSPYFARFGVGPVFASLIGGVFTFLAVGGTIGLLVADGVISGEDLRDKDRRFLESEGLLRTDEQPLYFYSIGVLAVSDEGNLLTDQRVLSYARIDGELWVGEARFDEILDIQPEFSESELVDTEVYIEIAEEEGFYVVLSMANDGDHLFVDKLTELWKAARKSVVTP